MFWRKTFWWLLALFLLSVAVRVSNLNRPLSKHHEFCTALTLMIVQAWNDDGIASLNFNPSTTFSLPADKFINNCSMDTMQRNGNFYYLSHPPLAYYVPYAVFKILGAAPSPLGLQIINLVFEFITVVFVYLIASLIFPDNRKKSVSLPALIAASIYLFLPVTLWFHSNAYMADMFVQNLWAPALFVTLKIFLEEKEQSIGWLSAFGISIFLMTYTDWLGALFSGVVFLVAVFHILKKKERSFIPLAFISVVVPLLTILLVIVQYASINGWGTLFYCYVQRYTERGSLNWSNFRSLIAVKSQVAFNYVVSYAPVLPFLVVLLLRWKSVSQKFPNLTLFTWLSLAPVLADHLLFLRYAVQDFGVLKASFFLSISGGVTLCIMPSLRGRSPKQSQKNDEDCFSSNEKSGSRTDFANRALPFAAVICLVGVGIYFYINRPGDTSLNGDKYDAEMKIGVFINRNAKSQEVVFLQNTEVTPQIAYYAHRNIKEVRNAEDAISFLKRHPANQSAVFIVDHDSISVRRISE